MSIKRTSISFPPGFIRMTTLVCTVHLPHTTCVPKHDRWITIYQVTDWFAHGIPLIFLNNPLSKRLQSPFYIRGNWVIQRWEGILKVIQLVNSEAKIKTTSVSVLDPILLLFNIGVWNITLQLIWLFISIFIWKVEFLGLISFLQNYTKDLV